MKYYVCRRIRLYSFLSQQGYIPIMVQKDKYDPHRLIWLYEETDELKKAVCLYYEQMKK